MATDLERLVVQLSADVKGYQNALNRAQGITNRQARAIESRFEKMNSNINASFRGLLTGSVAGIGTALGTREIAQYADAWTEAGNKINAAAQSAGVQARSLSQLKDGANEARSAFGDYADLYARLIRSASNVAKNENEIATATSVVAKAFKAGGAAASEQAAGILQLGQALGSGVLQGDELRSLRENAPILADAIAKEFKTTISGLKELGAEGKLTSDRVFKAILNAQKPIEAQFAATNATIGDAFTRLKNQMMEYVGGSDSAFGASAKLNEALGLLSNNFGAVADAAIVMAGAFLVNYAGNAANAAVAATYKMVAANTAQRVASVESARTALASAQAIQASAAANLQYAQTALVAARNGTALGLSVQQASRAMVVAQAGMVGANAKVMAAQTATNAAIAATGIVATTTAGAMRLLSGALALVGGPAGAALLAAYALYQLYDAQSDAEKAAKVHGEAVNELKFQIENLDYANGSAVASTRTKIASDIEAAKAALERAKAEQALAASIVRDEVNPSMSLYPVPTATDVDNTVNQNPVVKERQQLIDQLDKQLKDLEGINTQFESYASGKEKPTRNTTGFGAGIGAASLGKTKVPKKTADDRFREDIQAIKDRTAALIQEQSTVSLSYQEQEKRRLSLDLEQRALADLREEARKKGQTDLESIQLSAQQKKTIDEVSSAYAKQADALRQVEEAQQRAESSAQEFYDAARTGFADVITGAQSLSEALSGLLNKLADLVLNSAFDLLMGGSKATSSGGWLTKLFSGFADGGYTGDGGKYQPAGVVHKGEYVFDQAAVKAAGGPAAMEAMRRNLKGYANGGPVGISVPSVPSVRSLGGASQASVINYAPVIDARGADAAAVARIDASLQRTQRDLKATILSTVREAPGKNIKLR